MLLLLASIIGIFHVSSAEVICPRLTYGDELRCAEACCRSLEGENQGYFCCQSNNVNAVEPAGRTSDHFHRQHHRAERFAAVYAPGTFQIDWSLFIIGLIISLLLSVLLSFLCCLLCNGCWLHRRRNPHMYENVGERGDDGFYHICCGFGIPTGTVVFSTHPPQFSDGLYGGSSAGGSMYNGGRNRVRFNADGTPRGVLKNGEGAHPQQYYPPPAAATNGAYHH